MQDKIRVLMVTRKHFHCLSILVPADGTKSAKLMKQ
jgi:hypothetical protein